MFWSLFVMVACIFLMMTPGYIAVKRNWLSPDGVTMISRIMVYAIYPCLIFSSIVENFTLLGLLGSWVLPVSSIAIMFTGYVIGLAVCRFARFPSEDHRRSFLFQTTMNNYSFFPLAIVTQLYGGNGVAALIFSTIGAEMAMWTVGVMTLSGAQPGRGALNALWSPPMLALYVALACLGLFAATGWDQAVLTRPGSLVSYVHHTIKTMGACTVPMSMIVAGARIAMLAPSEVNNRYVWSVTALRLIVVPLAAVAVLQVFPLSSDHLKIMTIVAVMPVSLASLMLTEIFGGDKALAGGSVLLTHVMSLITVPLLLSLLL